MEAAVPRSKSRRREQAGRIVTETASVTKIVAVTATRMRTRASRVTLAVMVRTVVAAMTVATVKAVTQRWS